MNAVRWATVGLCILPLAVAAQPTGVAGTVTDAADGRPLPGATVQVQGSTSGASTDVEGRFQVQLPAPTGALVISFVGYRTATIEARDGDRIEVRLLASPYDLQPVIVSAGRHAAPRAEVPVAVAAVSAADLAATRPVLFSDALNRLPGVLVVDLGNEQHAMSIRQPMSTRSLYAYLEDGIAVRPAGLFNHNALIELNMAGAERIEVVRGPASALHGAGAVGGAVNVVTPAPPLTPTASAALRGSANGYARLDASAGDTWGRLGVRVDGYASRQRDGRREHTDYDRVSATVRGDYALARGTRLTGTLATGHLQTDADGALDSLTFAALEHGGGLTSLQTFTYRRVDAHRLTLRLNRVWNEAGRSSIAVYGRDNSVGQLPHYRIRRIASDPSRAHGEVNSLDFRSLGFDARHEMIVGPMDGRVVAGVTVDRSPGSFEARYLSITRDPSSGVFVDYVESDSLLSDFNVDVAGAAAFARFEASPLERLRFVAAMRYDGIRYGFDNHLPPSAFSGAPDGASTFSALSPHLGATWTFASDLGLYANAGRGFVPPEVSELYSGVSVPTLRPARFTSYEAGGWVTFAGGRVQFEGSAYVMNGTDEIISVRLPDDSQVNRNAGETRHAGIEYAAVARPISALTLRIGGSNALHEFVRHEEEGVTLDGNDMPGAPGWVANGEVALAPGFAGGGRLALEWQHVGPYWMNSTNTARYEGYDVINLRASYRLAGAELWVQVLNLSDAHYATMASRGRFGDAYTAGSPRTLVAGVRYGLP